jgi:CDP-glucose 4,6-dehydratase
VNDIVDRLLKLMGSNLVPDVRNEASNEIRLQYLSAEKARKMLDWKPLFTTEEALRRTVDWYTRYLSETP